MTGLARIILALLLGASPAAAQQVTVDSGTIAGTTIAGGVKAWMGVPFAAPPVRELRWKPPQPAARWAGTRAATMAAPMCPQPGRGRTMNHYFGNEAVSEDCLYLNVWTPPGSPPAGKAWPVVVWIYGGAFNVGSTSMANYSGAELAKKGVVQVNIAYRVGPLGFLAHPELTREGGGHSGNYGLMDQIAGLEWVKRNIAAFGGDPGNVTIAGQSAGSMSVAMLQISPLAKGLFHRVVGMSGSPWRPRGGVGLAEAEQQGLNVQKALGAANIEAMRDLPSDRILAGSASVQRDATIIDGRVITGDAAATFAAGGQSKVPLLIGFTRDEGNANLGTITSKAEYEAAVRARFGAQADAVLAGYAPASDADLTRATNDLQRDMSLGQQVMRWATAQAKSGAPAYVWLFARRQPYADGISFADHDAATAGAYHTGDVPYWFQTLDSLNLFRTTRNWTAADRALGEQMSDMLVRFARGDAPDAAWPVFDPAKPKLMWLDLQSKPIDWPRAALVNALNPTPAPLRAPQANRPRD
ncbi:carboxylesterase family protein [Sandarakinorhabdus sp.]|uniref:carboxylesterase/lipase family protein n=1 Tax=Sandarakinorhabdus sp. TaxID=1916663 RepID=UPI0033406DE6